MITVDIDTGGTMTDALVSDEFKRYAFKVDTTPHDYTVSFVNCLREAATNLGYASVEAFLEKVGLIRWSSTITTNVLAERRGSKVGVLVSRGSEQTLYGDEPSPVLGEIVEEGNIIGLGDHPTPVEILAGIKQLLEGGVRRICVCLANSFPDNTSERRIKEAIEEQYPDHIIGSVPVLLGSEMASLRDDQTRVHCSLINAYTHAQLASSLFKADDMLRDEYHWRGSLLIGHTNGGVARIGKTKAVDTIESGPVFGTFGGAHMARLYDLRNVVCLDVGGTTAKASIVRNGAPLFQRGGELMDIPVKSSLAMLRSVAVGGGSVAQVMGGAVMLGPKSMGAVPGPACYGLGGESATLTDALLILGYLDPTKFFGGRRILDVDCARAALKEHVAVPLGISVEAAALSVRDEAIEMMVELLRSLLQEVGVRTEEFAFFAFGGNGPIFATLLAQRLELTAAYIFDMGPVFSTFGSAVSDVVHHYERGLEGQWDETLIERLLPVVEDLAAQAERDLRGEGFEPHAASFTWQLDLGEHEEAVSMVEVRIKAMAEEVVGHLDRAVRSAGQHRASTLLIRLSTNFLLGNHDVAQRTKRVAAAPEEVRPVRFDGRAAGPTPVLVWEALNPGDIVCGPAVINGATLTCPVPRGWNMAVDDYGNGRLTRSK